MQSEFHKLDKNKIKKLLQEFYIEFDNELILPKGSKFGYEIEFKIPGYKTKFIDFLTSNLNDDISELSNLINSFFNKIGYNFPWDVTYEMNEHLEIISPVLTGNTEEWNLLDEILLFLINNGAYYSGACGAHIHIEKSILNNNKESWLNFFKLWCLFEDTIIKFTNGENYFERKNFSTSSKKCKEQMHELISNIDNDDYKLPRDLCNKKSSLMLERKKMGELFAPIKNKNEVINTIEFRCPNGTLNKVIWQNNTRLFLNLLSSAANNNFDIQMLDYYMCEEKRTKEFIDNMELYLADFIFETEYDKLCFLRQYYKDFNEPSKYNPLTISTPFWK